MKRLGLAIFAFCVLALGGLELEAQTNFVVVVHEANPDSSVAKADLAKLFLKKTSKWASGLRVQPVDQAPARSVRGAFTKSVHGKSVSSVKAYWQKLIFSGRGTPPPELNSDREVLDYVRNKTGAIGYVSADAALGRGVKRLRVTQ